MAWLLWHTSRETTPRQVAERGHRFVIRCDGCRRETQVWPEQIPARFASVMDAPMGELVDRARCEGCGSDRGVVYLLNGFSVRGVVS
jgi:hypothetical protein